MARPASLDLLAPSPRDVAYVEAACAKRAEVSTVAALWATLDAMVPRRAPLARLWPDGDRRITAAGHAAYERLTGRTLAGERL